MSISYHVFTLTSLANLSLEQCIPPSIDNNKFPYFIQLNQKSFLLDTRYATTCHSDDIKTTNTIINNVNIDSNNKNTLELIVFSPLTLISLLDIQTETQLTVTSLGAINNRANQISYRFNITCNDVDLTRKKLAEYTLNKKIEAVIMLNAPCLSKPGLLVMDMDSTAIKIECIDEIAILAGVGEQVSAVTELAMQGELDFAQSLHQRVATLKNSPEQILIDVIKNIPLMEGLEILVSELKNHHWRVAIASGGFTYFADHLKTLLNLDDVFANQLEIADGYLTGKVLGDIVDAQIKADTLNLLADKYQIDKKQTVAMGDGANDLVMMEAASLGVAFHAKPIVLAKADTYIHAKGLDCLLHWLA